MSTHEDAGGAKGCSSMGCKGKKVTRLAQNEACAIDCCECGTVRFKSGGLSLSVPMDAFLKVALAFEEATEKIIERYDDSSMCSTKGGDLLH